MNQKVLIIDDDETNAAIINSVLLKNDFETMVAHDGEDGLALVLEDKPDLIVLDIEMPKMNGYTFINEMKKHEHLKDTPVIVLTAHDNMEPIFKMKGIKHYLVKPVNMGLVVDKIKEVL